MTDVTSLWSYLATTPLIWLTITILAYLVADGVARRLGNPPWANPVLLSVLLIAPVLWLTRTDYSTYFEGAQFIHFLLGPATVALALPLWDNRDTIRTSVAPIMLALVVGSIVAAGSAILLARAFGLPMEVLLSLAPKSTTAPVARHLGSHWRDSCADRSFGHYDRDHRGCSSNAFDEFVADHRLAGARFCRRCCRPWNRDGPRVSGKPCGGGLRWHRHGAKRSTNKPDRTAVGALAGVTTFQLSPRVKCGFAPACWANASHLTNGARHGQLRPTQDLKRLYG